MIHDLQNEGLLKIKRYYPHYIVCDRAYGTETIRRCINEEIGAFDIYS